MPPLLKFTRFALPLVAALPAAFAAAPAPSHDESLPVETRVEYLLSRMTLDEKLGMLGGVEEFYLDGVERLGVPKLKMGDGPVGVRNWGSSTLYPATILMAATWNEDLVHRFGVALGRDSRARGMHISLAPGVNIYRSPLNGRNYEYLGEDPHLASRLVAASVRGVQSQGVAATVKHFAANNSETRRSFISNEIDERTLREIYLPGFRSAVQDGGAWCVMNAYNLLNGEYCTANSWLTNQVLKKDWAFPGIVMSDWQATHDTVGAALGGLDLEMPGARYFAPDKLKPLLADGTIPPAVIDDKIRRTLRMIVANGWLTQNQTRSDIPLDDPTSAAVALDIAREGIVLLKNENALLPLDAKKLKTIVVVGPNADRVVTGLGSGRVRPFHSVSFLDGLRTRLGADRVVAIPYTEPLEFFDTSRFPGMKREIFTIREKTTPAFVTDTDTVALSWDSKAPADDITARDQPVVRWSGPFSAPADGDYQFVFELKDANLRVWIDGVLRWDSVREATGSFTQTFVAGKKHELRFELEQRKKDRSFTFRAGWGPARPLIPAALLDTVRRADAVLACVGFNVVTGEGEGFDRTYELPGRQEELIRQITALNPRTIVSVNAGGSVATAGWIANVPAFLHTFYSGQEGGTALAEILCGDINPSGRLPISYEKRWEDCAAFANYPKDYTDFSVTRINYAEGIFLGYRWFDARKSEPLFPFGHGLSYTTFAYTNLQLARTAAGVDVEFDVTNTGARAGTEVAQLYVGQPTCSVPRPVRELKGFQRVALAPGETKRVQISLGRDAFQFFHPEQKKWVIEASDFILEAGQSSRVLPLKQTFPFGP